MAEFKNPHPGEIAAAEVAKRIKNPHPPKRAPKPTHRRIKADGTKVGPIKRTKGKADGGA